MSGLLRCGVLGATGFVGAELIRLLSNHPRVELVAVTSEQHPGKRIGQAVPGLRNSPASTMTLRKLTDIPELDVAFCCFPSGVLPSHLGHIQDRANLVVNLAGDYRLRAPEERARHYPDSPAMAEASYYVPELAQPTRSRLVNLPGCMAVAAIYALQPLFRDDLVAPEVVVDAKTGSSGSGSQAVEHPAVRDGNVRAHRLHGHRHGAEIRQAIVDLTGKVPDLQFSVFSLPVARGVHVAVYTRLLPGRDADDVRRAYAAVYREAPFVRVHNGRSAMSFPMLNTVVGTNVAELGCSVDSGRCVTVVALDNLVKGGAGQAVQAINQLNGWSPELGLSAVGRWP
jgi:N-acetyl-gamma-glutamyl-phosphate/LysW-gamma-L-alpha-aminoadipyl-6-phosphate reductase